MNPPHNNLTGRKYSSQPEVGIPIALKILEDIHAHRNDVLSATCYLGYRVLDKTYKDVDFIWPKIQYCRDWALKISPPDGDWFRTRWVVSYSILSIYFRIYIHKENPPMDLISEICDEKYALSHPPQFVNILRACAIAAIHCHFLNKPEEVQKYLNIGINCYKKAVPNYKIDPNRLDNIIYESGEAIEALNTILEAKYTNFDDYNKLIDVKWKPKSLQESRGPFYKTVLALYRSYLKSKK